MNYYNMPQMTRNEFINRLQAFVNIEPEGSDTALAATEIIEHLDLGSPHIESIIDADIWERFWTRQLSTKAAILGAEILYGDISANPDWLKLDMTGVPHVYQQALRPFMEQFLYIMEAGVDKGYKIYHTLEAIDWQIMEGQRKFGEFKSELAAGDTEKAGRVLTKIATAAFALYAAYCHWNKLQQWYDNGQLSDEAVELLDSVNREDRTPEWC